jgi:hypothetical protein
MSNDYIVSEIAFRFARAKWKQSEETCQTGYMKNTSYPTIYSGHIFVFTDNLEYTFTNIDGHDNVKVVVEATKDPVAFKVYRKKKRFLRRTKRILLRSFDIRRELFHGIINQFLEKFYSGKMGVMYKSPPKYDQFPYMIPYFGAF